MTFNHPMLKGKNVVLMARPSSEMFALFRHWIWQPSPTPCVSKGIVYVPSSRFSDVSGAYVIGLSLKDSLAHRPKTIAGAGLWLPTMPPRMYTTVSSSRFYPQFNRLIYLLSDALTFTHRDQWACYDERKTVFVYHWASVSGPVPREATCMNSTYICRACGLIHDRQYLFIISPQSELITV